MPYVKFIKIELNIYPIIAILIIISNATVIYTFASRKKIQKKIPNMLLLNQACVDMINGLFTVPMFITTDYLWLNDDSIFFDLYVVFPAIESFAVFLSLLGFITIATDRCIAVAKPFQYKSIMTTRRVRRVLAVVWSLCGILAVCCGVLTYYYRRYATFGAMFLFFALAFVPVVLYAITFYKALMFIRRKKSRLERRISEINNENDSNDLILLGRKRLRLVCLFAGMYAFFCITYLPIPVLMLCRVFISSLQSNAELDIVQNVCWMTAMASSIVNPVLTLAVRSDYSLRMPKIASHVINWFYIQLMRVRNRRESRLRLASINFGLVSE